jgi:hypothetical protein
MSCFSNNEGALPIHLQAADSQLEEELSIVPDMCSTPQFSQFPSLHHRKCQSCLDIGPAWAQISSQTLDKATALLHSTSSAPAACHASVSHIPTIVTSTLNYFKLCRNIDAKRRQECSAGTLQHSGNARAVAAANPGSRPLSCSAAL